MSFQLTVGCLEKILSGHHIQKPVLQCLGYKKIPGSTTSERFRLLMSDSELCYPFCMLGTKYNNLIQNGDISKFSIIRLDIYMCNQLQPDKRIIVMTDITLLAKPGEVGRTIGSPRNISSTASLPSLPAAQNGGAVPNSGSIAAPSGSSITSSFGANNLPGPGHSHSSDNRGFPNEMERNIFPIVALSPYQNRWTIRARVTSKTDIRTWSNSRGEGKLFSMDLVDESGEIRATAFNAQCDKFYDMIVVNKVYYITKCTLKPANKQYTSIRNDYEMSFTGETQVTPCHDVPPELPSVQFNFVPISHFENAENGSFADVIGVCTSASDVQNIISRNTNKEFKKRDITLVDKSNVQITLTLWGNMAEKFDPSENPIVAAKGVKVSEFGGKSLTCQVSTTIHINPDIREAHVLRGWYDREGSSLQVQSLSVKNAGGMTGANGNWKTLAQVKGEMVGIFEKPEIYMVKGTVMKLRDENLLYMACPNEQCNKKVVDLNNGCYRCEKCSREYQDFKWRLLLSMNIADFSDHTWATCFQDVAENILGLTAERMGQIKSEGNSEECKKVIQKATFKPYIFTLRTRMEEFKDENRLKTTVLHVNPVTEAYGQKLLNDIKQLEAALA